MRSVHPDDEFVPSEADPKQIHKTASSEVWENVADLIEKGDLDEAEIQLGLMVEKPDVSAFNKFLGHSSLGKCKRRHAVASADQNLEQAVADFKRALEVYKQFDLDEPERAAEVHKEIGSCQFSLKNFPDALQHLLACFEILRSLQPPKPREVFDCLVLIADAEVRLGAQTDAIESYKCCLALAEENPDLQSSAAVKRSVFGVHKKLGQQYKKLGQLEEFVSQMKLASETGTPSEVGETDLASVRLALGSHYLSCNQLAEARLEFESAAAIYLTADPKDQEDFGPEVSRCYLHIGSSHLKEKNYSKALEFFELSLKARSDDGQSMCPDTGQTHLQRGLLYLMTQQYSEAVAAYDSALACFGAGRPRETAEW